MTERAHLEWLVPSRSKIQALLLRLYEAATEIKPASQDARSVVFQLLLGAAFSLWRAVFLLDKTRDRDNMHKAAMSFLKVLIEDNTILYRDDRNAGAWAGGYYLANACFRLRELGDGLLAKAELPTPAALRSVEDFLAKSFDERLTADATKVWDDAYGTAQAICDSLEAWRGSV